mgnify:FL=1
MFDTNNMQPQDSGEPIENENIKSDHLEENSQQPKATTSNETANQAYDVKNTRRKRRNKNSMPLADMPELIESEAKVKELEKGNKKLQEEISEWKDKFLRLFSEFDNFKKRNARERLELTKSANTSLIVKLLPVLDDFERALDSLNQGDNEVLKPYHDGIELIYNKFYRLLEKEGLNPIDKVGEPFNTDYHEALTTIPAPNEEMKGKVVEVIEKGYMLHDKVIRFAKVIVGS